MIAMIAMMAMMAPMFAIILMVALDVHGTLSTSGRYYCCKPPRVFGWTDLGLPFVTGLTIEDADGVSPTKQYDERPDDHPCDGTRTEGHAAIITIIGAVVMVGRTRGIGRKSCGLASGLVCRLGCGISWHRSRHH